MTIIDNKTATEFDFPRQPGHVVVTFTAEDPRDARVYLMRVANFIENSLPDDWSINDRTMPYTLTIHPRAVND